MINFHGIWQRDLDGSYMRALPDPTSSDHWEQLYVEAWDQARHSERALLRFKGRPYHAFAPRIAAVADALVFWRRCERSLEHLGEGPW